MTPRDVAIFVLGLQTGWFSLVLWRQGRVALWRWLCARHDRVCLPLKAKWRQRVVRHPLTGRVGVCLDCCTRAQGWRDLVFPRWRANVSFSPELAMRVQHLLSQGGVTQLPLRELALAPASDVEEFRRRKEEA